MDKGNPLPHRAGYGSIRNERNACAAARHLLDRHHRYLHSNRRLRCHSCRKHECRHRLLRLVWRHGNGHHRHGRTYHHHFTGRRNVGNNPLQRWNRLHHYPPYTSRHRQERCRTQYSRIGERCQSLHRQQHHCYHYHRTYRQRHSQTLPPGPPENGKYPGYVLLPHSGHHPLRRTNADSRGTGRNLTA